eukprot:10685025-Ditylum_brightwellii.AAC.1
MQVARNEGSVLLQGWKINWITGRIKNFTAHMIHCAKRYHCGWNNTWNYSVYLPGRGYNLGNQQIL